MSSQIKSSCFALVLGLILIFYITLFKAGAPHWASLSWVSLCGAALSIILILRLSTNHSSPTTLFKKKGIALLPAYLFVAFQAWTICQHLFISPDKAASLNQSLIGVGMIFLLAIWSIASRHPKALFLLYCLIIASAIIQSVYGLWIYASDTNLLLWMPKLYYLDRPTGFFVNANHFAAYLVLAIILCLCHLMTHKPASTSRNALMRILDQLYKPHYVILCLLLIALLASKSIGAIMSIGIVSMVIGTKFFWHSPNKKTLIVSGVGLGVILILFVLSLDYSIIENQIADLTHTVSRRIALSNAALSMLDQHWFLGIGGGTFYSQFSPYRTLEIGNSYYNYAHNDILQFWIEYGLIGITILLLFVATTIRDNVRVLSQSRSGLNATFAYASIYSSIAVMVHSLVDFPLHIPGFSVCYLLLISINSLTLICQRPSDHASNRY